MKKYIVLSFLLVCLVALSSKYSFSYSTCDNLVIYPEEINTKNLKSYLNSNYPNKSINYICSYDYCYKVTNGDLDILINDYITLLAKNRTQEQNDIAYVKGYSITKISINNCY